MNREARYEAFIPPQPKGLTIVTDAAGRVWQYSAAMDQWTGVGLVFPRKWKELLIQAGPVYPVQWSDAAFTTENELGRAPDAGQPDHPTG